MPIRSRTRTHARNRSHPYPHGVVQLVTVNGVARNGWKTSLRPTSYTTRAPPLLPLAGNSGNNRCDWRYESYLPRRSTHRALQGRNSLAADRPRTMPANFVFSPAEQFYRLYQTRIMFILTRMLWMETFVCVSTNAK